MNCADDTDSDDDVEPGYMLHIHPEVTKHDPWRLAVLGFEHIVFDLFNHLVVVGELDQL